MECTTFMYKASLYFKQAIVQWFCGLICIFGFSLESIHNCITDGSVVPLLVEIFMECGKLDYWRSDSH